MRAPIRLSKIIEQELESAPFIEEFLISGLANVTAVAITLSPLIRSKLGRRVSIASIGMALRRYATHRKHTVPKKRKFPRRIEIHSARALVKIAYRKTDQSLHAIVALQKKFISQSTEIFLIAHGTFELMVLTHEAQTKRIVQEMKRIPYTALTTDLGCVTVDWPTQTKDIPGIYYRVTRALSRRDISVQSFHSIGTEMMIVVKDKVLPLALATVTQLLDNSEFE